MVQLVVVVVVLCRAAEFFHEPASSRLFSDLHLQRGVPSAALKAVEGGEQPVIGGGAFWRCKKLTRKWSMRTFNGSPSTGGKDARFRGYINANPYQELGRPAPGVLGEAPTGE